MPVVLVGIDVFLTVLWVIAIALLISVIMGEISGALSGLPFPLNKLAGPVNGLAQGITHVLGLAIRKSEQFLGAAFHAFARYLDTLWHQFESEAALIAHLAEIIGGQLAHVTGLSAAIKRLEQVWHGIEAGVKTLTREFHGIEHRVAKLERELAKGIGNDVRVSVGQLEQWEKAAKGQLKADERAITQTIPGEITALENFIKAIPGTRYFDWAAGIVTAAIGTEIWNLFKCPSLLNSAKNRGCGLWNGLEDILGLFFDALIFADLCKILPEAVSLFGEVEAPLTELISGAANAACAQIPADWAVPTVAAGPLPPAQSLGNTLAA